MSKIGTGIFGSIFGGKKVEEHIKDNIENDRLAPIRELKSNIFGNKGFNYVVIEIGEDDKIISSPDSLIYAKGNIKKGEKILEKKDIFSKTIGKENSNLVTYSGGKLGGTVALSSDYIGDIIKLLIKQDESYIISNFSFLCSYHNIEITYLDKSINVSGKEATHILPIIKAIDGNVQVWLAVYGSFQGIELKNEETLLIDNGIFLAVSSKTNYEIIPKDSKYVSSIFGGEGFDMKFTGPGTVFIQTKNLNNMGKMLLQYINNIKEPIEFDSNNEVVILNQEAIIEENNIVLKPKKKKKSVRKKSGV